MLRHLPFLLFKPLGQGVASLITVQNDSGFVERKLSLQFAAGGYWPGSFDFAFAVAVGLFVEVHYYADVVRDDAEFFAQVELARAL